MGMNGDVTHCTSGAAEVLEAEKWAREMDAMQLPNDFPQDLEVGPVGIFPATAAQAFSRWTSVLALNKRLVVK